MAQILILDDDPDVRTVTGVFFKKQGYKVDVASHIEEAAEKIKLQQPDIVLLDVLLSGADGRNFCQQLKKDEQTKSIRVIMFSAHPGAAESIEEYGADDFIQKPFELTLMLDRINSQMKQLKK